MSRRRKDVINSNRDVFIIIMDICVIMKDGGVVINRYGGKRIFEWTWGIYWVMSNVFTVRRKDERLKWREIEGRRRRRGRGRMKDIILKLAID